MAWNCFKIFEHGLASIEALEGLVEKENWEDDLAGEYPRV